MKTYQIEVDETTYRKFAICGQMLNEPDASKCFEKAIDALVDKINLDIAIEQNEKFVDQAWDWLLHPSSFDGAEAVFGPPQGMTEDEVHSLCAARVMWGDDPAIVTCWKPTRDQLDAISESGRVWLIVFGDGMPPVAVASENPIEMPGIVLR